MTKVIISAKFFFFPIPFSPSHAYQYNNIKLVSRSIRKRQKKRGAGEKNECKGGSAVAKVGEELPVCCYIRYVNYLLSVNF